jgi:hypothetical protein
MMEGIWPWQNEGPHPWTQYGLLAGHGGHAKAAPNGIETKNVETQVP